MRLVLAAALAWLAQPATAEITCAEVFALLGRAPGPGAAPAPRLARGETLFGCTPGALVGLVYDVTAAERAEPVTEAEALHGTWVSDDVLGIYAGIFIPVYEILEIAPGEEPETVEIVQKVLRAYDPAEWFRDTYDGPSVDVVAAGRIAIYGTHRAELTAPGELQPLYVRYRDVPMEMDRGSSLAMQARMMSFAQARPIAVGRHEDRLVFTFTDRMAEGGARTMTFARHAPETPEHALRIALLGEITMSKFHCFLNVIDGGDKAFAKALGDVAAEAFFDALATAERQEAERQALSDAFADAEEAEVPALRERIMELVEARVRMWEEGPLVVLRREIETGAPFGCPDLF